MGRKVSRKRQTAKRNWLLSRALGLRAKRVCAAALCVTLTMSGSLVNMAAAASEDEEITDYKLTADMLYSSICDAVETGRTVDADGLDIQGQFADDYYELLKGDGETSAPLYELIMPKKSVKKYRNADVGLRVFVRLDEDAMTAALENAGNAGEDGAENLDAVGESDYSAAAEYGYEFTGDEKVIFVLTNDSDEQHKASITVNRMTSGVIAVTPESWIDWDENFGDADDMDVDADAGLDTDMDTDAEAGSGIDAAAGKDQDGSANAGESSSGAGNVIVIEPETSAPEANGAAEGTTESEGGNAVIPENDGTDAETAKPEEAGGTEPEETESAPVNESEPQATVAARRSHVVMVSPASDSDAVENDEADSAGSGQDRGPGFAGGGNSAAVIATSSDAEKATSSDAELESLDGELYNAVLLDGEGAMAYVVDAGKLDLDGMLLASDSDAKRVFVAEDGGVVVRVVADKRALPESAALRVKKLNGPDDINTLNSESAEGGSEDFAAAKKALDENQVEYDGMMAFDIGFVDVGDVEIEPDQEYGSLAVSMKFKPGVLPENISAEALAVQHLKKDENGAIAVESVVDNTEEKADGNVEIDDKKAVAEFEVDSFSTFTVTWESGQSRYLEMTVNCVDVNGNSIGDGIKIENKTINPTENKTFLLSDFAKSIAGYRYREAKYVENEAEFSNSKTVTHLKITISGWLFKTREVTLENNRTSVFEQEYSNGQVISPTVYFVYEPDTIRITDTISIDGKLNAVLSDPNVSLDGKVLVWSRSDSADGPWTEIQRQKVTTVPFGQESIDYYNLSEDQKALFAAFDNQLASEENDPEDLRRYYKVAIYDVGDDGTRAETPIAESDAYQVPYYDALQNGSFEKPVISNYGNYQPFYTNNTAGVVWKTTSEIGSIEYVSADSNKSTEKWGGTTYRELSIKHHKVEAAADGTQYAELNAEDAGALYQDVMTAPGAQLYWSLAHRARGMEYQSGEEDTMYVLIMSTKLAEEYDVNTQTQVNYVLNNIGEFPGASVQEITSNNKAWTYHEGDYNVPKDQYLTRFFFVSGLTASGDDTIGNHLDKVWFSTELPDPAPDKGHIIITKKVKGISEEDIGKYTVKVTVKGNDNRSQEVLLNKFSASTEPGVYVATGALQNIDVGNYTITEKPILDSEILGKYNQTGAKFNDRILDMNNALSGSIVVDSGKQTSAVYENTYMPSTAKITVTKIVDGSMGDKTKEFTFNYSVNDVPPESFELTNGVSKELTVAVGSKIIVAEDDYGSDGYATSYVVTGADKKVILSSTDGRSYTIPNVSGDLTITFTNMKKVTTPTGLFTNNRPYILMLLAAFAGLGCAAVLWRRKSIRSREDN